MQNTESMEIFGSPNEELINLIEGTKPGKVEDAYDVWRDITAARIRQNNPDADEETIGEAVDAEWMPGDPEPDRKAA